MLCYLGLDVGTQGARALLCSAPEDALNKGRDRAGRVIAHAAQAFSTGTIVSNLPAGHVEQMPQGWWQAAVACLRQVTAGVRPETIGALSVTSTSGTLCLLDPAGEPIIPALMYNDARARDEANLVQSVGAELADRLGYRFNSSFALAKLVWLARHRPDILDRARYIAHAADFIVGRLCGIYNVTDYSNALKTGYDLSPRAEGDMADHWPTFLEDKLHLPVDKLPRVVAPGQVIGGLTEDASRLIGLQPGTPVVAGMTDGCAGQIAAGAVAPGDWNSTLGTTLVIKGVTRNLLRDPQGRIYSHRHPDGYWLPGGASNVGGEILTSQFPSADLAALDRQAAERIPTHLISYPLARRGERFPFVRPDAQAFVLPYRQEEGEPESDTLPDTGTRYTAYLEGVAYVERLAYQMLESLGGTLGPVIRVAGGGARSDVWLAIRASVLNRELLCPVETGAAMGAAILAASRTHFEGVIPAARAMVHIERRVQPRPDLVERYEERYQRFRIACAERGYI
jgi:sugar (pentulose or hexulose) kinase